MIDRTTVDRIIDAADVVDVVSGYVTLRRRGVNYTGLCPFHDEKTPSFSVSPAKNLYKCFGCGKGGSPVNFVMEMENLSYYEALKFLAKKYNIEVKERQLTDEEIQHQSERESMLAVTSWLNKHFVENLHDTDEGRNVGMSYFVQRGFREDIVRKFQLGYAMSAREEYTQKAQAAGLKLSFLEKTGVSIVKEGRAPFDRFAGRVMFPIHSISGQVIAFGGRTLKKDDPVKYQNSPESDIYNKSNVVYGIYFAKNAIIKQRKCYIVEGYADVISMVQAGVENIVAPCGTALTSEQIRLICRILPSVDTERGEGNKNVTMLYDCDKAGLNAALKNGKKLLEEGLNVKVVVLPPGDDPDSFAQSHDSSEVRAYLDENEQDYIYFKIDHYEQEAKGDPIKKAQLIMDIADTIAVIPDQIKRSVYIKECAKRLDTEEANLRSVIGKKRNEAYEREAEKKYAPGDSAASLAQRIPDNMLEHPRNPETPRTNPQSVINKEEFNIIYFFVRYGGRIISFRDMEGEVFEMSVADYILRELREDDLMLSTPIYREMMESYERDCDASTGDSGRYFMYHHNPEYSKIASDILSDEYTLSRMFDKHQESKVKAKKFTKDEGEDENLSEFVPHVVKEYKFRWLHSEQEKIVERMRDCSSEEAVELTQTLMQVQRCLKELAKEVGERIVVRS